MIMRYKDAKDLPKVKVRNIDGWEMIIRSKTKVNDEVEVWEVRNEKSKADTRVCSGWRNIFSSNNINRLFSRRLKEK